MSTHRVGVEVTRRHTEAAVLAPDGTLLSRREADRSDIPSVVALIGECTELAGELNVGIAADGDFPREELERALGRPIRLAPRAACLALSEGNDGSAVADEVVFAAILGATATGGLSVRGRVRGGDHQLDPSLANAGFCDGLSITVPEVMLRVRFADAVAVAAFERYLERLVRALVEITETYSPTVIVLGGTIGRLDDLYTPLAQALEHSLHRGASRPAVQKAAHGESSVIRGAAALWPINAG